MTEQIDPRRAALLVMDYQNAIVDMLGEHDDLLSRAADAIAIARARGAQVGYVGVAFIDADFGAVNRARRERPRLPHRRARRRHIPIPIPRCTSSSSSEYFPGRQT